LTPVVPREGTLREERVERRLAAILVADIAGYSRLMGQDEAGTLARLKALRRELIGPRVADHKGRIVKTTGDGILIEFPSVVEAVACAAAVQREMAKHNAPIPRDQKIEFRVGINLGDIIVEDGDIYGDGVNVAARLEALAEPGGICVSARVQEDAAGRLDLGFADLGEQDLKNIARPVRVYRVRLDGTVSTPAAAEPTLALPDKPSIAVLPFSNMSSDPEQEFFADGIAEDVITALSRYPSLFVIARNSSFTYKSRAVDVKQIGRDLGVRYVLEGSLRKAGERIRVTAQLIEAETGNHLWAERYDRALADIFAVQDEITEAVTIAVAPTIAQAERQRSMRKRPENLDAWGAYQRGLSLLGSFTPHDNLEAQKFLQRAVELDPNFAGSYGALGIAQLRGAQNFGLPQPLHVVELARRGVAADSNDAEARVRLSFALLAEGDHEGALGQVEEALKLSPNLASAHEMHGSVLMWMGHPAEGRVATERAIRIDPRDPQAQRAHLHVAISYFLAGEYEAAIEAARRAIRAHPDFPMTYHWLAAALGQAGRISEAEEALRTALAVGPAIFDVFVRNRVPWHRVEDHERMLEGLCKAGWTGQALDKLTV
jgi:adenylate cyclase